MRSRLSVALIGTTVAAVGAAVFSWRGYDRAVSSRDAAVERAERVRNDVEELLALRASTSTRPAEASTASLLGPLNQTLGTAGVPLDSLVSASPETASSSVSTGAEGTDATRIVLERLTLSQLGATLAEWRSQHPSIIPAAIEITPINDSKRPDHIRARILLVTTSTR